ncbi:MAG: hypothetical protein IT378_07405 [Sandaracinaceae bacterium]|nr:hypothetical protein [Sandaracinaceae bacterium]
MRFTVWLVAFLVCGCTVLRRSDAAVDGPTDNGLAALCQRRVSSTNGCSDTCNTAVATAQASTCGAESGALSGHTEAVAFDACTSGCSVVRTCANGTQLIDCACVGSCGAARSPAFQSLLLRASSCVDSAIATACY